MDADYFCGPTASSVIYLWDAPAVVREFLETGDESKRAAARDAARDAQRDPFARLVNEALSEAQ